MVLGALTENVHKSCLCLNIAWHTAIIGCT